MVSSLWLGPRRVINRSWSPVAVRADCRICSLRAPGVHGGSIEGEPSPELLAVRPVTAHNPVCGSHRKKLSKDLKKSGASKSLAADIRRATAQNIISELPPGQAAWSRIYTALAKLTHVCLSRRALHSTNDFFDELEIQYMPGGPPMSPVTDSFFMTWQVCDLDLGKGETLATIATELAALLGLRNMQADFRAFARSYCGLYEVQSEAKGVIRVVDLHTGAERDVRVVDTMPCAPGTLWWTRLLPPRKPGDHWTSIGTPYILVGPNVVSQWRAYFDRVLAGVPEAGRAQAYVQHLKAGPHSTFWLDYVMDGYVGQHGICVELTGIPDRPDSLPHSEQSEGLKFAPGLDDVSPFHRLRERLAELADRTGALDEAVRRIVEVCGSRDLVPKGAQDGLHPLVHAYAAIGLLDDRRRSLPVNSVITTKLAFLGSQPLRPLAS